MSDTVSSAPVNSSNYSRHTVDNWFYRRHIDAFLERLTEMVVETEPESVLDAGCGEGFVVKRLSEQLTEVRLSGVDISEEAIAYAKEQFGDAGRFRKGSVYKLPYSDNSFDTVICSEVLEHLDDPNRAIQQLKRVARNYVVITVPHEPYFQWLNTLGRWMRINPDAGHVNFWTARTFDEFILGHFKEAELERKQLYQLAKARV